MSNFQHQFEIPEDYRGQRLDAAIANLLPDYSRARIQQWIKQGHLLVNRSACKAKMPVEGGEQITIDAPPIEIPSFSAENITLDIVHTDEDIIVINKPVGLVAHPAAGNYQGTLLNALLYHFPELREVPRAGIVHRLDKDTSGLLVIARNIVAHTALVSALQARDIKRQYFAIVQGDITAGGTIETQMGRHPRSRLKMAVVENGKDASTHYRVAQRFAHHTLLNVELDTGRTHQIRVHMAHINHAIVGDQLYGKLRLPKKAAAELRDALVDFKRQALHAHTLGLEHPRTGEYLEFTAPLPDDMTSLLNLLATHDGR
jgi:23S rRNA pseudouridine1911/1915/1917 synthase